MAREILAVLSSALFLLSIFQQHMTPSALPSDRQKAGYLGPVHKVTTETATLSRKLYRESDLIEDTTGQFENGRFLAAEEEFDENGRLVADASSEREMEQEPFRSVYHYDASRRLTEESHFKRDGSPAGRKLYVYDSAGKKVEELFYSENGVPLSRLQYDDHQNVTHIESFGPDGSTIEKQSIVHSYRREGNTLEDSYTLPQPTSGMYLVAASPKSGDPSETAPLAPQQVKNLYTYNESGQVIKEFVGGYETSYDSKGRVTWKFINSLQNDEKFGDVRTTHFYDEQGRVAETLVHGPTGADSVFGGSARYVYKYDSHGMKRSEQSIEETEVF